MQIKHKLALGLMMLSPNALLTSVQAEQTTDTQYATTSESIPSWVYEDPETDSGWTKYPKGVGDQYHEDPKTGEVILDKDLTANVDVAGYKYQIELRDYNSLASSGSKAGSTDQNSGIATPAYIGNMYTDVKDMKTGKAHSYTFSTGFFSTVFIPVIAGHKDQYKDNKYSFDAGSESNVTFGEFGPSNAKSNVWYVKKAPDGNPIIARHIRVGSEDSKQWSNITHASDAWNFAHVTPDGRIQHWFTIKNMSNSLLMAGDISLNNYNPNNKITYNGDMPNLLSDDEWKEAKQSTPDYNMVGQIDETAKYIIPANGIDMDTDLDGNDYIPILADGNNGVYIKNDTIAIHARPITDNVGLWASEVETDKSYGPDNVTYTVTTDSQKQVATAGHKRNDILKDHVDTCLTYHTRQQYIDPGKQNVYGFEEMVYLPPLDPTTMSTVTVKYVDQAGHDLADSSTLTGKIGQSYSAKPLDIKNYQLAARPKEENGKYEDRDKILTYVYDHGVSDLSSDKAVKRTIKYEMAGGDSAKKPADTVQTGHATQKGSKDEVTGQVTMGDWVNGKLDSISVPHIDGYTSNVQSIPEMAVTKDTPAESTVTVTYTPDDEHVKVRYIDQDGKYLANADTLTGKMDSEYHTQAKQIDGYKVTKVPANANGKYGTQNADVVYQYEPDIRKINVHYVDTDGNKLHDDTVIQGQYKSQYTTQPVSIHGWHVKTTPKNAGGTYQVTNPDITYIYERNRESAMLYYVDQNGAPMETPEKITGLYGDHYKTIPETFEGYHLTQSPKNAEGVLDDTNADIVYRYAPDDASVNVVHKNLDMDDVSPSSQISGKVNTYYKTDKATPNGHHWTVMPWNAKGPFRAKNDDVKYIYDTDIEHIKVRYVDKNGKDLLPPDEVSGHYGTQYAAEAKKVWDYHLTDTPDNATGTFDVKNNEIKFVYEPDTEHVKVSYFDDWGNKLADDDDVTGDFGSDYKTTPKTFAQYQLINSSSNANGKFGRHNADVHYVYTKVENPSSASSNSSSASSVSSISSIASSQSSVISSASSVSSESSYISSVSSDVSSLSSTSSTSSIASSQSSAISSASSSSFGSSYVSSSSAESYVSSTGSNASSVSSVTSSQSNNQISSSVSSVSSSQASSVISNSSSNTSASINTKWIDENGSELKQSEDGSHPDNDGNSDIKGYQVDSVEVDKNGNVINRYKKVDPETKLVSEPATIQKQDSNSQIKANTDNVPNQKATKQKVAKSKVEKPKAKHNEPKTLTQEHTKTSQPAAENTSYAQPMSSSSVQPTDSESYSGKGRLPQTNTNEIGLSAAGMALLSSLGLTAVVRKRKEE